VSTKLDIKLAAVAKKIIAKHGKNVVIKTFGTDSYDRSTGVTTRSSPTNHTVKASPPEKFDDKYIDDDLVKESDCFVYVARQDLVPTLIKGLEVTFDSVTWKIERIIPLYSGEDIAAYQLHLRQ